MLKLLKKSEIDAAKANDRQREIVEGAKLAKRVDALRAAQATEEANLEKFRREMVFSINEEIVSKTRERDVLSQEVSKLEDRRRVALEPLTKEWEKIEVINRGLEIEKTELNEREAKLHKQEGALVEDREAVQVKKRRIEIEHRQMTELLREAEKDKKETQKSLVEAQKVKDSAIKFEESILQEVRERDAMAASNERDLENIRKQLASERKEFEKEKIRLADQRATLERAMKRLKK